MVAKTAAYNIFLFGLGIFNAALVVAMIALTKTMLMAADIFMTFIIVLSFWAVLFYILTGEFPVHIPRKIPKKPGIPIKNK